MTRTSVEPSGSKQPHRAALWNLRDALNLVLERPPAVATSTRLSLPSLANCRLHWRAKAAQTAAHRTVGRVLGHRVAGSVCPKLQAGGRAIILLTRVAARQLDSDNLEAAFKAIRDGVADILGVDDRDSSVLWLVDQRTGSAAVELEAWVR